MSRERELLLGQFDLAWKLLEFHLEGLTTDECLWRPANRGLHVHRSGDGHWQPDWPDREDYDIGPPSIAWITWHIGYWWSMVLDHSFGTRTLSRDGVYWPGDADGVRSWLTSLRDRWRTRMELLTDDDVQSRDLGSWPYADRPFSHVAAWVNIELTKNAAEIGYARFVYAVR